MRKGALPIRDGLGVSTPTALDLTQELQRLHALRIQFEDPLEGDLRLVHTIEAEQSTPRFSWTGIDPR